MELQIEGRHFKVTEAIQTHLEEKLAKLEKYFDGIHRMHVILDIEKNGQKQTVELVCTVAKRHTLVATGSADDLYVAIDQAEKKMLTEMKKYKAVFASGAAARKEAPNPCGRKKRSRSKTSGRGWAMRQNSGRDAVPVQRGGCAFFCADAITMERLKTGCYPRWRQQVNEAG